MKKISLGLLSLVLAMAFPAASQAETVVEKVARTGVLTVGTSFDVVPYSYIDAEGELVGYSIDVVDLIEAQLEAELDRDIVVQRQEAVDAIAGDSVVLAGLVAQKGGTDTYELAPAVPYESYGIACMVPQNNSTFLNMVDYAIGGLLQGYIRHNTDMNHPFRIISIDHQGNFATFDPELLAMPSDHYGDFVLGNVVDHSFEEVCQTPKFQRLYAEMQQGVALCRKSCEYFGICGGGAGSNKYWENGTFASTETQACRYRIKAVTDIALAALEDALP